MKIKFAIADPQVLFAQGLTTMVEQNEAWAVVASANSGRAALEMCERHRPDILLSEIALPELNGIDLTLKVRERFPSTKVIIITTHVEGRIIEEVLHAGTNGFLLKKCTFRELESAVEAVMAGHTYLTPAVASELTKRYLSEVHKRGAKRIATLTPREREVLQLIAEGKSTKEIAHELGVSIKTIETHRKHLMTKLDVDSLAALVKYAIKRGLTTSDY